MSVIGLPNNHSNSLWQHMIIYLSNLSQFSFSSTNTSSFWRLSCHKFKTNFLLWNLLRFSKRLFDTRKSILLWKLWSVICSFREQIRNKQIPCLERKKSVRNWSWRRNLKKIWSFLLKRRSQVTQNWKGSCSKMLWKSKIKMKEEKQSSAF